MGLLEDIFSPPPIICIDDHKPGYSPRDLTPLTSKELGPFLPKQSSTLHHLFSKPFNMKILLFRCNYFTFQITTQNTENEGKNIFSKVLAC